MAHAHQLSTVSRHGPHVSSHIVRNATFHLMQWTSTVIPWCSGQRRAEGAFPRRVVSPMPSYRICPHSHLTHSIRRAPHMGSHDVQWCMFACFYFSLIFGEVSTANRQTGTE